MSSLKAKLKEIQTKIQDGVDSERVLALCDAAEGLAGGDASAALHVARGVAGARLSDWGASEAGYVRASELTPDAPKVWQGLLDARRATGAGAALLVPPLAALVRIARARGNRPRSAA